MIWTKWIIIFLLSLRCGCLAVLIYFCCRDISQGESNPGKCPETRVISRMSLSVLAAPMSPCRLTPTMKPSMPYLQELPTPRYTPLTPLVPMVPPRRIPRTSASTATLHRVSASRGESSSEMYDWGFLAPQIQMRRSSRPRTPPTLMQRANEAHIDQDSIETHIFKNCPTDFILVSCFI